MAGPKITQAEKEFRISFIFKMIVGGTTGYNAIVRKCKKLHPEWKVTDRQIRNYISEAYNEIKECSSYNRDHYFGLVSTRLEDLYETSNETNDKPMCLSILREEIRLHGLVTEKFELNGNIQLQNIPPELLKSDDWKEYTRLRREEIKKRKTELKDGTR
jgi:hypothetical protein